MARGWVQRTSRSVWWSLVVAATAGSGATADGEQPTHSATQEGSAIIVRTRAEKISQLVGDFDRERQQPTDNRTGERYSLAGTDLGVPFRHRGKTFLLFGDSGPPEHEDPLAFSSDEDLDDGLDLAFYRRGDGRFAPVEIPGISLGEYEVPMEGVSLGESMLVYATTGHTPQKTMGRSVVARSDDDGRTFELLYELSEQHFINVSVVRRPPDDGSDDLILFGSGDYRRSNVHLARQPIDRATSRESIRFFAGLDADGKPRWSRQESEAQALFEHPVVGELSASWNRFLGVWILLYNSSDPRGIVMRTAEQPWGPWSDPQVVFDPWQDEGYCHFIHASWERQRCDDVHDPGREREWGGEYGPYQFEHFASGDDDFSTIYFTLSTWNPYTVVLMRAKIGR